MAKTQLYKVIHTTQVGGTLLTARTVVEAAEIEKEDQKFFANAVKSGSIVKVEEKKPEETSEDDIFGDDDADSILPPADLSDDDEEGDDSEDLPDLDGTPLTDISGIGAATKEKLEAEGVTTAEELKARIGDAVIKTILASNLQKVQNGLEAI